MTLYSYIVKHDSGFAPTYRPAVERTWGILGWVFKWQQFCHTVNLIEQVITYSLNVRVNE